METPNMPIKETATMPARWGAPVVSVIILVMYSVVLALVMTRAVPTENAPVLNVLLGTLGAQVVGVGNYWLGSSAGSARKDATLAAANDQTVAVATAAVAATTAAEVADPVPSKGDAPCSPAS